MDHEDTMSQIAWWRREPLIPFAKGRSQLPDHPTYKQLVYRHEIGVVNKHTGKRVFLKAVRIGSTWSTSMERYAEFIEAENEED